MKAGVIITILVILLVGALGYIGYGFYSDAKLQQQMNSYREGAQAGYEQAVVQMFQQAATCQQVPLSVQNKTINIVAVECLQQAASKQQLASQQQVAPQQQTVDQGESVTKTATEGA